MSDKLNASETKENEASEHIEPDMFDDMVKKQKEEKHLKSNIDDAEENNKNGKEKSNKKLTNNDEIDDGKHNEKDKNDSFNDKSSASKDGDKSHPKKEASKKNKEEDQETKYKKMEKMAYDNHRLARHERQKTTDTIKLMEELVESGDLDEETLEKLSSTLKKEFSDKSVEAFANNVVVENPHPLHKYKSMLNEDIFRTYVDVSEDAEAEKKLRAFDVYLNEASDQEIDNLEEELSKVSTPMGVLKKILSIGGNFLNDGFNEFYNYGGFREFLKSKNDLENKMQKDIDKLTKKLLRYEEQTSAGGWLNSESDRYDGASTKNTGDMFDDMMARKKSRR